MYENFIYLLFEAGAICSRQIGCHHIAHSAWYRHRTNEIKMPLLQQAKLRLQKPSLPLDLYNIHKNLKYNLNNI